MIVECKHCGEPFDYWDEGTKGWVSRVPEEIVCPHCGGLFGHHVTIGYVQSRKLTAPEREKYEQSKTR